MDVFSPDWTHANPGNEAFDRSWPGVVSLTMRKARTSTAIAVLLNLGVGGTAARSTTR